MRRGKKRELPGGEEAKPASKRQRRQLESETSSIEITSMLEATIPFFIRIGVTDTEHFLRLAIVIKFSIEFDNEKIQRYSERLENNAEALEGQIKNEMKDIEESYCRDYLLDIMVNNGYMIFNQSGRIFLGCKKLWLDVSSDGTLHLTQTDYQSDSPPTLSL